MSGAGLSKLVLEGGVVADLHGSVKECYSPQEGITLKLATMVN